MTSVHAWKRGQLVEDNWDGAKAFEKSGSLEGEQIFLHSAEG